MHKDTHKIDGSGSGQGQGNKETQQVKSSVSPTLGVVYLLSVAIGAFILRDLRFLGGLLVLQMAMMWVTGGGLDQIPRMVKKLAMFSFMVVTSYAIFGSGMEQGPELAPLHLPLLGWPVSKSGIIFGSAMVLRVWIVVLTSSWVRSLGRPTDFVIGLRRLGLSEMLAELLSTTLALLEGDGGRQKGGRGSGKGQGGGKGQGKKSQGAGIPIARLLKGDISVIVEALERSLKKARNYYRDDRKDGSESSLISVVQRDAVILAGLLLMMLGLKALKIMPGLPFAPGHKGIILIPIYLLASRMTTRKNGATLLGCGFGILSFLFGDGRYGVLEVLKHIAPGLVADATIPWVVSNKDPNKQRSFFIYGLVGAAMAVARWGTIALVLMLVGSKELVLVFLPVLGIHIIFGILSGFVTATLFAASTRLMDAGTGDKQN